jgi:hypothetical protein
MYLVIRWGELINCANVFSIRFHWKYTSLLSEYAAHGPNARSLTSQVDLQEHQKFVFHYA